MAAFNSVRVQKLGKTVKIYLVFFSFFQVAHFGATVVNWTADSARHMPCTRQIMLSGSNQERTKSEKTSGNSKLLGK
jgi:hypothetical protein